MVRVAGRVVVGVIVTLPVFRVRRRQRGVLDLVDAPHLLHDGPGHDAQNKQHQGAQAQEPQGAGGDAGHSDSLREPGSPCQPRGFASVAPAPPWLFRFPGSVRAVEAWEHHVCPGLETAMNNTIPSVTHAPWNKGKLTGRKSPLRLNEIYAIRVRLQLANRTRDLALFNLALDSKLRACDLLQLRVHDVTHGSQMASRAVVMQKKTKRPVQFEITEQTRSSLSSWITSSRLEASDFLFPSRVHSSLHLTTRQYARIVHQWVRDIGLDDASYGTHSMRRTKAALIYRRTHNLRAVQLLLGHTKIESTVRYLGVELDDALELAEQTDI